MAHNKLNLSDFLMPTIDTDTMQPTDSTIKMLGGNDGDMRQWQSKAEMDAWMDAQGKTKGQMMVSSVAEGAKSADKKVTGAMDAMSAAIREKGYFGAMKSGVSSSVSKARTKYAKWRDMKSLQTQLEPYYTLRRLAKKKEFMKNARSGSGSDWAKPIDLRDIDNERYHRWMDLGLQYTEAASHLGLSKEVDFVNETGKIYRDYVLSSAASRGDGKKHLEPLLFDPNTAIGLSKIIEKHDKVDMTPFREAAKSFLEKKKEYDNVLASMKIRTNAEQKKVGMLAAIGDDKLTQAERDFIRRVKNKTATESGSGSSRSVAAKKAMDDAAKVYLSTFGKGNVGFAVPAGSNYDPNAAYNSIMTWLDHAYNEFKKNVSCENFIQDWQDKHEVPDYSKGCTATTQTLGFVILGIVIFGGLYALMMKPLINREELGLLETNVDAEDNVKNVRQAARGGIASILVSMSFGAINGMVDATGSVDPSTSTALFGMLLGGTIGYLADAGFGSDEGLRIYQNDGFVPLWKYIFGRLKSGQFVRYQLTILFDTFISLILFKPIFENMLTWPFFKCPGRSSIANAVLSALIASVTFNAYANQTRFLWAYPDVNAKSKATWIRGSTMMLATAILAVVFLGTNTVIGYNPAKITHGTLAGKQLDVPKLHKCFQDSGGINSPKVKLIIVMSVMAMLTAMSAQFYDVIEPRIARRLIFVSPDELTGDEAVIPLTQFADLAQSGGMSSKLGAIRRILSVDNDFTVHIVNTMAALDAAIANESTDAAVITEKRNKVNAAMSRLSEITATYEIASFYDRSFSPLEADAATTDAYTNLRKRVQQLQRVMDAIGAIGSKWGLVEATKAMIEENKYTASDLNDRKTAIKALRDEFTADMGADYTASDPMYKTVYFSDEEPSKGASIMARALAQLVELNDIATELGAETLGTNDIFINAIATADENKPDAEDSGSIENNRASALSAEVKDNTGLHLQLALDMFDQIDARLVVLNHAVSGIVRIVGDINAAKNHFAVEPPMDLSDEDIEEAKEQQKAVYDGIAVPVYQKDSSLLSVPEIQAKGASGVGIFLVIATLAAFGTYSTSSHKGFMQKWMPPIAVISLMTSFAAPAIGSKAVSMGAALMTSAATFPLFGNELFSYFKKKNYKPWESVPTLRSGIPKFIVWLVISGALASMSLS